MKKNTLAILFTALLFGSTTALIAQTPDVDRTKYPDYTDKVNPDWSLMAPAHEAKAAGMKRAAATQRPDHVNNAETRYFPPVFNQAGGSCGSASRICYMFSHELAAYRDVDGSKPENYYPSHFVWLHTNSNHSIIGQGKDAFVMYVGVPSAATYGGQTYSSLFGYQEETNNDFGWMQGYDKWFEAMHNRMLQPSNFPVSVKTEEGREAVKNWLWNHNGDNSFHAGGICGIGVASGGVWRDIPKTETNDKIGVTGMGYVYEWGTSVDHALTIVGYDDRIEFDLDKDGIIGETNPNDVKDKDTGERIYTADVGEVGAWIIVNSWGGWENDGFIYCPYAHGGPMFQNDGNPGDRTMLDNYWTPEVYKVRKDYRPLRTIKLKMDYSHRSEIALSAGVSSDLNATEPENTVPFVHFTYAGDGSNGDDSPAPKVPMLGRWADGKLHTEPMEFGYDLTDLSSTYDLTLPLKYFFIIDSRSWAEGEGTIYDASIIDYRFSELGVETPFATGEGIEVKNAGGKTIISVIVQGGGYNKPQNAAYADGILTWQAPMRSGNTVTAYDIYLNGTRIASQPANLYSYTPLSVPALGEYGVTAVYADGGESECAIARIPLGASEQNVGIKFNRAGFTIPDVMDAHYENATIEFWIKPNSTKDWNQSGGPGWGYFMFHTNANGAFTAGWNTNGHRVEGTSTALKVGQWTHVAIVADGNKMIVYLDGVNRGSVTSSVYSGLGGFGDLVFASGSEDEAQDATYDEIRIWNTARTATEIKACMKTEFAGSLMPQGLVTYLRGDIITNEEGEPLLYDCAGGHHATLQGNYDFVNTNAIGLGASDIEPTVTIVQPEGTVYAGIPVTFTATYSTIVNRIAWTADGAGFEDVSIASPTMTFATAGTHMVTATAYTADGRSVTTTCEIIVAETPEPDAAFSMTGSLIPAGEGVTFHAQNPMVGYIYQWDMPGADTEEGTSPSISTTYQVKGTYAVTLTVTAPDGTVKSHTEQIEVLEVAPKAALSIMPAVVLKGEEVNLTDESLYTPTRWEWRIESDKANYIAYDQYKTLTVDKPGVYQVTLSVANDAGNSKLTRQRALIVTNADSKNGLLFSNDAAAVNVAVPPLTKGMTSFTIDWWMNTEWPADETNGIGDTEETVLLETMSGGKMRLHIGGKNVTTSDNYVIPNEWHHYAVTFGSSKAKFYRDGVLIITRPISSITALPELKAFRIGGAATPFRGSIDELRVWGKELSETQLQSYANAPITDVAKAESSNALRLYYNFNQNGGDVQDATSNANHGLRTGFGPDGDAWGLSKGVFCLNFDEVGSADVTGTYLKNYAKSFADNNICINPNNTSRFYSITGWTIENTVSNAGIVTGAHVDREKNRCFTITTGWDGFATSLDDHKVFQTMTLPAGYYTFKAVYDEEYEGQCGESYLVVAKGNTLPVTDDLDQAIAYAAMKPKGQVAENSLGFVLSEETTVSVGMVVNMSGSTCMTMQQFALTRSQVTIFAKSSDALSSTSKLGNDRLYYITLPYHKKGLTSWAVAQGGDRLKSNADLGIDAGRDNTAQQFAILSNNEGATRYLYHAAEKKFVGKDGSLTDMPIDPIHFKPGAYDTTFVAYFDEQHYINVGDNRQMTVNEYSTPDGGNSVVIRSVKTFNPKSALTKFPVVEVEKITLNHGTATLMAGNALALQATITPSYATAPTVTWSTSDASVAIVVRGVVTAVAPGTATITAKSGNAEATCVVTVEKRYVEVLGLLMSQSTASVEEGEMLTLVATVTPENADDKTITWETSDETIATVDNGVVTGLAIGTVTITAKAGGRQVTCIVEVKKRYIPVTDIILNYTKLDLFVGEKAKFTATVLPENADNKDIIWASSNDDIVKIGRGQQVTAKAPGEAFITATTADYSVTCVVTVKEPTSIDQVSNSETTLMIYDITGRPVRLNAKSTLGLDPGTYIINGRKTVVK